MWDIDLGSQFRLCNSAELAMFKEKRISLLNIRITLLNIQTGGE